MSLKDHNHRENHVIVLNPVFRSDSLGSYYNEYNYPMIEKRQLFLRSYQFSRHKSLRERITGSLVRVKKVFWFRLRSARKWRKFAFSRFKWAFYHRKRRFVSLLNTASYYTKPASTLLLPASGSYLGCFTVD